MIRILCLAVALLGFSLSAAQAEGPLTLIFAHHAKQNPFTVPTAALAWKFKESVEQASEKQIRVQIVPDSQIGDDATRLDLLKRGVIHSTLVSAASFSIQYPPMLVTLAPFVMDHRQQANNLFSGPFGQSLLDDIFQTTGYRAMALPAIEPLHVISSQRQPILMPEDAEGLPIAFTPEPDLTPDMLQGLSATSTPLPIRQIFQYLDSGQADGFCGTAEQVLTLHLDEVQSFVTISHHRQAPMVWLFHPETLASLSDAQQQMIQNAIRHAILSAQTLSQKQDQELISTAKLARVLELHSLTSAQRAAFQQKLIPSAEQAILRKAGDAGVQWLTRLREAAKNP